MAVLGAGFWVRGAVLGTQYGVHVLGAGCSLRAPAGGMLVAETTIRLLRLIRLIRP